MRNLLAPAALIAGLLVANAALAAPASAPAPTTSPPPHASKSTATPADPAQARCTAAWQAQTNHTQTKAAFMAACLNHG